jgi:type VI secretion system secreted protein VgrG
LVVALLLSFCLASSAAAAQPPVRLGTAADFGVLAGSTVTNTGPTVINGDLGVQPGTAVTGFPPGTVHGTVHAADAVAGQAQNDVTTAYDDAASRSPTASVSGDLVGRTLTPGVYRSTSSLALTGDLTLDAQDDPGAVFVFQVGSTLTTGSASHVRLTNGAQGCHVYWQVGSSATLGTSSTFVGNVLALTSITATTGANVDGSLLARNGAVTLDTNTVTRAQCATSSGPPTIVVNSPTDGAHYRQGSSVPASYSCTDPGSVVTSCSGPVASGSPIDTAVPGEHAFTVTASDQAGNTNSMTVHYTVDSPSTPRPDNTPPTVVITRPASAATYYQGQTVTARYSADDNPGGSGIRRVRGTVANGSRIDTRTPGRHTFEVTATDNAGNATTRTVRYTVAPSADVAIAKQGRPRRVQVGDPIAYTLRVTNLGPSRATGMVIRDRLPGAVRLVAARPSRQGSCSGVRTVTCRFPRLRRGNFAIVRIVVRARRGGRIRNTADVSARQHDGRRANNTSSARVTIVAPPAFTG